MENCEECKKTELYKTDPCLACSYAVQACFEDCEIPKPDCVRWVGWGLEPLTQEVKK
jgi:hypothetical protein